MRTVIFDLDGTLADTSGDLIAAANQCFAEMGVQTRLDPAADAGIALRGGRAMLTAGLTREGQMTDALVDQWYPKLLVAYGRAIAVHTVLYDGAMEAVDTLRTTGHAVGICTNKPAALAEDLMQKLGVRSAFGSLIGADTLPVRKPDPAPFYAAVQQAGGRTAQSCLVGDTATDRNTARAAGVPSILVTFGPAGADMAALEPDATLDHFRDLPGLVDRLLA